MGRGRDSLAARPHGRLKRGTTATTAARRLQKPVAGVWSLAVSLTTCPTVCPRRASCLVFYGLRCPVPTGVRVWHTYIKPQDSVPQSHGPPLALQRWWLLPVRLTEAPKGCEDNFLFRLRHPVLEHPVVYSFIVCIAKGVLL